MKIIFFITLCAAFLFILIISTPKLIKKEEETIITPTPPPSTKVVDEVQEHLLSLHNKERIKFNVLPLKYNSLLNKAAQKHNDWMANHGRLTHDEPRNNLGSRINNEGYGWSFIGENIAKGQNSAEEVMNSWMHSSGHRANILNKNYKEVGFGVTKINDVWWWTSDFGG